jgi:hypothetical protein
MAILNLMMADPDRDLKRPSGWTAQPARLADPLPAVTHTNRWPIVVKSLNLSTIRA